MYRETTIYGEWISTSGVPASGIINPFFSGRQDALCLHVHADSVDALMSGDIAAALIPNGEKLDIDPVMFESQKALNYLLVVKSFFKFSKKQHLLYKTHFVGKRDDGSARQVTVFDISPEINLRAGVTIHYTNGSWSSFPMHKFEANAMVYPADVDFREVFAYITNPPHAWAIQTIKPRVGETRLVPVMDRDILDIPLSSHPVVASPGTRLAYIWAYTTSGDISAMEKFSEHGRV